MMILADNSRTAQDEHTYLYIFEISIKIRIDIKYNYFLTSLKNFLYSTSVVDNIRKICVLRFVGKVGIPMIVKTH